MGELKAPFPYFGGKSKVADVVWDRLGNVPNYVEPFAGSLAVLLSRPHTPKTETVNDADGFVANFWRALQYDPDSVASYADWPVNELDLHARHQWLVDQHDFVEALRADPDYYDVKIAGWWVWGICAWIGPSWCSGKALTRQIPHLGDGGQGVHCKTVEIHEYMRALSTRLRRMRVCCGDWSRVCGPSVTFKHGITGVFLDPPYGHTIGRDNNLYAHDMGVTHAVHRWCVENQNNQLIRIALCGYEGEYELPGWNCFAWKAHGGYGARSGNVNNTRERIWFSPHCLDDRQLFAGAETEELGA